MTTKIWAGGFIYALLAWVTLILVITAFSSEISEVLIPFPAEEVIRNLPSDVAIVSSGSFWIQIKKDGLGLASEAYQSGAWIVLPAGLTGCF